MGLIIHAKSTRLNIKLDNDEDLHDSKYKYFFHKTYMTEMHKNNFSRSEPSLLKETGKRGNASPETADLKKLNKYFNRALDKDRDKRQPSNQQRRKSVRGTA